MKNSVMNLQSSGRSNPATGINRYGNRSLVALLKARLLHDQSGQSLLETAVAIPTFLLMLIGLFDFSAVLMGYENATFACRAAARYAAVHSSTSLSPCTAATINSIAQRYLWASPSNSTVSTTWSSENVIGSTVTVSVTATYSIQIPFATLTQVTFNGSAKATVMR